MAITALRSSSLSAGKAFRPSSSRRQEPEPRLFGPASLVADQVAALTGALKQRRIVPVVFIEQVLQRLMLILAGQFVAGLQPMALVSAIGRPSASQIS